MALWRVWKINDLFMKNTVSGGGIIKALSGAVKNAPGGNIISRTTQRFINTTKVFDPISGRTHKLKDLLEKPTVKKKLVEDIFAQAEKKGILREKSWTKTPSRFFEKATQEDKKITSEKIKKTNESQKIQANKQPEAVKPEDKKASNIAASRLETERAKRGRGIGSISKLDQVREAQSKFRETYGRSADLGVKSRGVVTTEEKSTGLLNKVKQEEAASPSASKSGQKSGGNVSTNQKASSPKMVGLRGLASIGELSSQSETSNNENIPTGGIQVEGLSRPPVSQPEISPTPRSASASEDISDMDI